MVEDDVILVDSYDMMLGVRAKQAAHENGGVLHRALSVFVFNVHGELMLQQRALEKYHFGGLWTNTCCSHPRPGELTLAAAQRRLQEELGFSVPLTEAFHFVYRAEDAQSGLTEHELDHVFFGYFDGEPAPDPTEVMAWRWASWEVITQELNTAPERYTPWFKIALGPVQRYLAALPENAERATFGPK